MRGRRGARLTALTSGGTIPDNADYQVILEPEDQFIGTVNEDFAVESMAGDVFQLGNNSYRIRRVERARSASRTPTACRRPFRSGWARRPGAATSCRCRSRACGRRLAAHLTTDPAGGTALRWLIEAVGLDEPAAAQLVDYAAAAHAALGCLPTQDTIVLERFFDAVGGMQLVIHSPYGSRINRAWGGAAQALLPQVQLRAAGRGDRGHDRALADHGAQL